MIQDILNRFKIEKLNPMQEESIGLHRKYKNILLLSPTGTGKTLGFLIACLEKIDAKKKEIQAIIIVPSRELSLQIEQVFKKMGTDLKVNTCYGGHSFQIEKNNLKDTPQVLIGTPGRLADHIRRNSFQPETIQHLILDEFDKSLELGFTKEMKEIFKELTSVKYKTLTSATQAIEIPSFFKFENIHSINYLPKEKKKKLQSFFLRSEGQDKLEKLFELLCYLGKENSLVFCNHRDAVDRISDLLRNKGIEHECFHGGRKQEERERALIKFRNGSYHILLTTDLASRGIDIPEIKNVIHYQFAGSEEIFVHRNGRTARMHSEGKAYLILSEQEYLPDFAKEAKEFFVPNEELQLPPKPEWVSIYFPFGKKDKINKIDIVGFLCKQGGVPKDGLGLIEVLDHSAFAAVKRGTEQELVQKLKNERIKNKKSKISISY